MKGRRLLIGALWLNLAAASATAETMVVESDPCPVPAQARLTGSIIAADLNLDRFDDEIAFVFYPVEVEGWASARILSRFEVKDEPRPRRSKPFCR